MSTNLPFINSPTGKRFYLQHRLAEMTLLASFSACRSIANYFVSRTKDCPLQVNQVLYEAGDKIDYLYFPLDSVVSGLAIMEDGTTIETSMVGRESLVGISTVLGSGFSRQWVWVTVGGQCPSTQVQRLLDSFVQNETALKGFAQVVIAVDHTSLPTLRLQHPSHDPGTAMLVGC